MSTACSAIMVPPFSARAADVGLGDAGRKRLRALAGPSTPASLTAPGLAFLRVRRAAGWQPSTSQISQSLPVRPRSNKAPNAIFTSRFKAFGEFLELDPLSPGTKPLSSSPRRDGRRPLFSAIRLHPLSAHAAIVEGRARPGQRRVDDLARFRRNDESSTCLWASNTADLFQQSDLRGTSSSRAISSRWSNRSGPRSPGPASWGRGSPSCLGVVVGRVHRLLFQHCRRGTAIEGSRAPEAADRRLARATKLYGSGFTFTTLGATCGSGSASAEPPSGRRAERQVDQADRGFSLCTDIPDAATNKTNTTVLDLGPERRRSWTPAYMIIITIMATRYRSFSRSSA